MFQQTGFGSLLKEVCLEYLRIILCDRVQKVIQDLKKQY